MSFWDPFTVFKNDPFFRGAFNDPFFRDVTDRGLLEAPTAATTGALTVPTTQRSSLMAFRSPRMDVSETENNYIIKADLPGLNKEDIHVHLQEDMLTIEGERREEHEEKDATRHLVERSFGKFSRSFRLPADADPEKCKATMENGVLQLFLEKREPAQGGKKRIAIQ